MRQDGWQFSTNAVRALQAMGTNVIPALLARIAYRDPVFNLDDFDVSMSGAAALMVLRERAKPALPALATLMDSDNGDIALRAMIATVGTGADAVPCLIKGLTNSSATVRSEAAHFLTELGAQYPEERKKAVPLMMKLLSDPDDNVRKNVTSDLREIDRQTATKTGLK
jgi:HEAT repeat protein